MGQIPEYLKPTEVIDCDHPDVIAFAEDTVGKQTDEVKKAVRLYYAVRDQIRYDPYYPFYLLKHYRASRTIQTGRGFCVTKAVLLCALARAVGIASRLGFADVKNHIASRRLVDIMGTDLFVYHGYTELMLNGRWVIATPAFDRKVCERQDVAPLEFNGKDDSVFQAYDRKKNRFMKYVAYHGSFADLPLDRIVGAWKAAYGNKRVESWIAAHENGMPMGDFITEEVVKT